jgi:uncharacterized protein with FMN-binding domain
MSDESHREFLLSKLRVLSLQAKVFDNQMVMIGIALKDHMITPIQALKQMQDFGAEIGMIPDEIVNAQDESDGSVR